MELRKEIATALSEHTNEQFKLLYHGNKSGSKITGLDFGLRNYFYLTVVNNI